MDLPKAFEEHLDGWLKVIDEHLAAGALAVPDRPFQAAVMLLRRGVLQVSTDGGETQYELKKPTGFAVTPWFRSLYKAIDSWYRDRFGAAFERTSHKA